MIGVSAGNGHPFSFSAIFNGFSAANFIVADWPVIYDYLKIRRPEEFGIGDARVTHAWTQNPSITKNLCAACRIESALEKPEHMIGLVDAVIIARDDYETHAMLAMPFLEAGLPVFVDKPLTVNEGELRVFRSFLENGKLMSCGGMRYAVELDEARRDFSIYGEVPLIRASILNGWEKYGIHMIDAVLNLGSSKPVAVTALRASHHSMAVHMDDGSLFQVDALGAMEKIFQLEIYGRKKISRHDLNDNFSMFRRILEDFISMVETDEPQIPPEDTIIAIKTLIAGRKSLQTDKKELLSNVIA